MDYLHFLSALAVITCVVSFGMALSRVQARVRDKAPTHHQSPLPECEHAHCTFVAFLDQHLRKPP